ncbi:MAG: FtsX-like permease family protein [Xanthomonadales bacterium]|nr:FtsX-like permease family protein [Xanthomonadales bacterium]
MTALLTRLLGRLPIGWLQLSHAPTRMAAAVAGVGFAAVLVLVQLGMMGALNSTVAQSYTPFRADLLISASDARMLTDGSPLARRWIGPVLADSAVAAAAPLYLGKLDWRRADGSIATLTVYGLPVEAQRFAGPLLGGRLPDLAARDVALIDRQTRGIDPAALAGVRPDAPLRFEVQDRTLTAIGTVRLGGGFSADGALIVSDQTFLRLFPQRIGGTPSHLLVDLQPGMSATATATRLQSVLDHRAVQVRTLPAAIAADLRYQTTQRPTGLIFGFGVAIGVVVGVVIVYQVLSTDVANHLREYATFKAMGYPHARLLGFVFEEAAILAVLGLIPALLLALAIYAGMASATGLPVAMTPLRAVAVSLGTLAACMLSGALAARRLRAADPAELF